MSYQSEEYRLRKIVNELIALTGSSMSCKECLDALQQPPSATPRRYASEQLVRRLADSSKNPSRFYSIIQNLQESKSALVGSFLLLLGLARDEGKAAEPSRTDSRYLSAEEPESSDSWSTTSAQTEIYDWIDKLSSVAGSIKKSRSERAVVPSRSTNKWTLERPHMSIDFVDRLAVTAPVHAEGPAAQEKQLVEDLLSCFLGFHGTYVTADPLDHRYQRRTFSISDEVDDKLKAFVARLLPLASHYSAVARFVEQNRDRQAGRVNQAFSARLDDLLNDFGRTVVSLEDEHRDDALDLGALWSRLQPDLALLHAVADLVYSVSVSSAKGGQTLNILHDASVGFIADTYVQDICQHLAKAAAVPYMESVAKWIYKGILLDPYDEFMVARNTKLGGESSATYAIDYWERRFRLRSECAPRFLEPVAKLILNAGKYMDIIDKTIPCTSTMPRIEEGALEYDAKDSAYLEVIGKAHEAANTCLYEMMFVEYDIMGWLETAKNIFCIEQGNLFLNIMDVCESELERPAEDICPAYLASLLNTALKMSYANNKYIDKVGFFLSKSSLAVQASKIMGRSRGNAILPEEETLNGFQALTFSLSADWPVSLLLNCKVLTCYQMLSRHLFYAKYVERRLVRGKPRARAREAFALKHRMVTFLQGLLYFMTGDTVQVEWTRFLRAVREASSLERVLQAHDEFLRLSMLGCLLLTPLLFELHRDVLAVCLDYARQLREAEHPDVARYDALFGAKARALLRHSADLPVAAQGDSASALSFRTDFNDYYTVVPGTAEGDPEPALHSTLLSHL